MVVVTERNFDDVVTPSMRGEFWRRVERALVEIFGKSADLLDAYRLRSEGARGLGQILVFHDEPLQIAADLAGDVITDQHIDAYERMFPKIIPAEQPVSTGP